MTKHEAYFQRHYDNISRINTGFYIISKNDSFADYEVSTGWGVDMSEFYWISNRYIVCGGHFSGIFVYDTVKRKLTCLPVGADHFKVISKNKIYCIASKTTYSATVTFHVNKDDKLIWKIKEKY